MAFNFANAESIYPGVKLPLSQPGASGFPSKLANPSASPPYIAEEALVRVQYRAQRSASELYHNFRSEKQQEETKRMTTTLTRTIAAAIQPPSMQESYESTIADQDFDQLLGELQGFGQPPALNTEQLQTCMADLRNLVLY